MTACVSHSIRRGISFTNHEECKNKVPMKKSVGWTADAWLLLATISSIRVEFGTNAKLHLEKEGKCKIGGKKGETAEKA